MAAAEPTPQVTPQAPQAPAEPAQERYTADDIRAEIEAALYEEILADITKNAKDQNPEELAAEAKTKASKRAEVTCQNLDEKRRKLEQRP